jgi:hypothetical protein
MNGNRNEIRYGLIKALNIWDTREDRYLAGIYRIIYISRFIGELSFMKMILYFMGMRSNKRLKSYLKGSCENPVRS